MSNPITAKHLEILQYATGLNKYGKCAAHEDARICRDHFSDTRPGHRNRFCAGESDEPICRELVAAGLMVQHETTSWLPYFNCSVTDAGYSFIRDNSDAPPKLTRSQKRYREFLNADSGLKFGEWIKWTTPHEKER